MPHSRKAQNWDISGHFGAREDRANLSRDSWESRKLSRGVAPDTSDHVVEADLRVFTSNWQLATYSSSPYNVR